MVFTNRRCKLLSLAHFLLLALLVNACGDSGVKSYVNGNNQQGQPDMTGIVKLAWDKVESTDKATRVGYRLYYGKQSGVYNQSVDTGDITEYTVTGLEKGQRYYFAVKTLALIIETQTQGESEKYSNEVDSSITRDNKLAQERPGPAITASAIAE